MRPSLTTNLQPCTKGSAWRREALAGDWQTLEMPEKTCASPSVVSREAARGAWK
jgi:hypothetical protein